MLTGVAREKLDRETVASRYAAWVRARMEEKEWDAPLLVRRSGLPRQLINRILNGDVRLPPAEQIATIAAAFKVDPTTVYKAIGLWDDVNGAPVSPDAQEPIDEQMELREKARIYTRQLRPDLPDPALLGLVEDTVRMALELQARRARGEEIPEPEEP